MAGYNLENVKWGSGGLGSPGGTVTWSFATTAGYFFDFTSSISNSVFQNLVRDAFQAWEKIADIDFVEVADSVSSDIRLGWDTIDGRNNTVGQAQYSYDYGTYDHLVNAEIRFDIAESWQTPSNRSGSTSFYAVALHEIGHALGLDHSTDPNSIMYPYIDLQTQLSANDIAGAQALYGKARVTTFIGTDGRDVFNGNSWAETITGLGGNDWLTGNGGNDYINGGGGVDVVSFGGRRKDYGLSSGTDGTTIVTDKRSGSPDGTDVLFDVERLNFSDGTLGLDIHAGEHSGSVYRLYSAAFERAPDLGGQRFWTDILDQGASLQTVAQGFVNSSEFAAIFGQNVSNAGYVDHLYQNLLGRHGEQAGVDYWTGKLNSGSASKAAVMTGFSESAENIARVAPTIAAGIWST